MYYFQDIFIRAVFSRHRPPAMLGVESYRDHYTESVSENNIASLHHGSHIDSIDSDLFQPVRIIHKEQDSILAFCLINVRLFYHF